MQQSRSSRRRAITRWPSWKRLPPGTILQRLLGLETIDGLGADLLADYHRLKRIVAIADGYVRFGGTDRWQALRDVLEEGVL